MSGVQAAKAGGFCGYRRLGDQQQLADIGADLVVTTLEDVSCPALVRAVATLGQAEVDTETIDLQVETK
jgi:hypothetical protein